MEAGRIAESVGRKKMAVRFYYTYAVKWGREYCIQQIEELGFPKLSKDLERRIA